MSGDAPGAGPEQGGQGQGGAEHSAGRVEGGPTDEQLMEWGLRRVRQLPDDQQQSFNSQFAQLDEEQRRPAILNFFRQNYIEEANAIMQQQMEEDASVNAAADYLDHATEDSAKRKKLEEEEAPVIDDRDEYDVTVAYNIMNPGEKMTEEQKNKLVPHASAIKNIVHDRESIDPQQVLDIAKHLTALGIRKNHEKTDLILQSYCPTLNPETREIIKNHLEEMKDGEKPEDDDISDRRADKMYAKSSGLRDRAEEEAEKIKSDIDARKDITNDEKEKLKGQVGGLLTRITDWFAPDEPGRDWARRVGKTLYFSLIIVFLLIILEMNLINKASGKRR